MLWVGKLGPGQTVALPDARHVHVTRGEAELHGAGHLGESGTARLTAAGTPALTAGLDGSEVLIWELDGP